MGNLDSHLRGNDNKRTSRMHPHPEGNQEKHDAPRKNFPQENSNDCGVFATLREDRRADEEVCYDRFLGSLTGVCIESDR
jgi:hypothetical protein